LVPSNCESDWLIMAMLLSALPRAPAAVTKPLALKSAGLLGHSCPAVQARKYLLKHLVILGCGYGESDDLKTHRRRHRHTPCAASMGARSLQFNFHAAMGTSVGPNNQPALQAKGIKRFWKAQVRFADTMVSISAQHVNECVNLTSGHFVSF